MTTMNEKAKNLIKKGQKLNDPEIVQMGYDLLEKHSSDLIEYQCQNCQHELKSPKKRKKCPECGKFKLMELQQEENTNNKSHPSDPFNIQIRNKETKKYKYDENGNIIGKIGHKKEFSGFKNTWNDDDTEQFNDEANKQLKKVTKVSKRNKRPVKKVKVTCDRCGKTEEVHPIHAASREVYVCTNCITRGRRH